MKKIKQVQLFLLFFLISMTSNSQQSSTPCNSNAFIVDHSVSGVHEFEIQNLCHLNPPAFYSYLWWMGDNGFCFLPNPPYEFQQDWTNDSITIVAIATGNYSSGGPPPVNKRLEPQARSYDPPVVIPAGNLYLQNYRNAVVNDIMYLIISYQPKDIGSGNIFLTVPPEAQILESMMTLPQYKGFTPNNEVYQGNGHWEYSSTKEDFHYSMLVPVLILPNEKEHLDFQVSFMPEFGESAKSGIDYFPLTVNLVESHDPNQITQYSDANNNCDYGGKPIKYTIDFQNIGDGETYYVKVVCQLDEKLDMTSIDPGNFDLPDFFQGNFQDGTATNLHGSNPPLAYYKIDRINHKLIFEFPGLTLQGTNDPNCLNLNYTKDQVSFSIDMLPNYRFGQNVISRANIFFDHHDPIMTNDAITNCDDPLPMTPKGGGGFYSPPKDQEPTNPTVIIGGLILLAIAFIALKKFRVKK